MQLFLYFEQHPFFNIFVLIIIVSIITPQLVGEARQLGCPKIVLVHVHVYICMYAPQCLSTRCIGGTSIGDALATGIQAPADPCKLMNIAIGTNYKVPDAACNPNIN